MSEPREIPGGQVRDLPPLSSAILALRGEYRGYRPYGLAKVRGEEMLYEFISWPWREPDGRVLINARPVGQPASMRSFECRKKISLVTWGMPRQRAYREGFAHGVNWAIKQAREFHPRGLDEIKPLI